VRFLKQPLRRAIDAAATLNGKSLALLIASSLVATSGIVVSAMSGSGSLNPLAAAAAQQLLEEQPAAVSSVPPAAPEAPPTTPSSFPQRAAPSPEAAPLPSSGSVPYSPQAEPAPESETPPRPPAEPELPEAGPIKHVFLISLASPGYDAAFGADSQMPYLSGVLRPKGVLLTNYSLLHTAALPNGIAAISGQAPSAATEADCPEYERCLFPVETLTLADQFGAARFTWRAYLEGMANAEGKPDSCVHPEPDATEAATTGGYSAKLNPFVYFHSLLDLGDCSSNDVPATGLAKDLKKKPDAVANFNYIAPNLCNSGFRGQCPEGSPDGAAAANAWLEKTAAEILSSPAYKKDGLLIVSFGATDPAAAEELAAAGADPLKVGALLVSPLLTAGGTDGAVYGPYSLLRSTDDLFGLSPLGKTEGAKIHSFASAFIAGETAAGD
jgi:phosphatidylinositol-3-phosphatase